MGRCLGKTLNFKRLLIIFGFTQIKGIRFSDELNICAVNFHQLRSPPSYSVHCQKKHAVPATSYQTIPEKALRRKNTPIDLNI